MMTVKSVLSSPLSDAYAAFSLGFSDYLLPVNITEQAFIAHFFGPEGNDAALSFLAYDGDTPAGLCLGGIRMYDGVKTMRCGTLCVAPDARALGVGRALLERHMAAAREAGCARLFLEVLTNNGRAIHFYQTAGYKRIHDLHYYSSPTPQPAPEVPTVDLRTLGQEDWRAYRDSLGNIHVNWQNEPVCFEKAAPEALTVLGAYGYGELLGMAAATAQGKICFLYVEPEARRRGIARSLLAEAARRTGAAKLSLCFTDDTLPESFLFSCGFHADAVAQYEMERIL